MFTKYFTDEQIIRDCVGTYHGGAWCKLCDAPVPSSERPEAHAKRHARELRDWRAKKRKQQEKDGAGRLAAARAEKRRQKEAGIE